MVRISSYRICSATNGKFIFYFPSKIEILVKNKKSWSKVEMWVKNRKCGQKLKFEYFCEIFFSEKYFSQESNFSASSDI